MPNRFKAKIKKIFDETDKNKKLGYDAKLVSNALHLKDLIKEYGDTGEKDNLKEISEFYDAICTIDPETKKVVFHEYIKNSVDLKILDTNILDTHAARISQYKKSTKNQDIQNEPVPDSDSESYLDPKEEFDTPLEEPQPTNDLQTQNQYLLDLESKLEELESKLEELESRLDSSNTPNTADMSEMSKELKSLTDLTNSILREKTRDTDTMNSSIEQLKKSLKDLSETVSSLKSDSENSSKNLRSKLKDLEDLFDNTGQNFSISLAHNHDKSSEEISSLQQKLQEHISNTTKTTINHIKLSMQAKDRDNTNILISAMKGFIGFLKTVIKCFDVPGLIYSCYLQCQYMYTCWSLTSSLNKIQQNTQNDLDKELREKYSELKSVKDIEDRINNLNKNINNLNKNISNMDETTKLSNNGKSSSENGAKKISTEMSPFHPTSHDTKTLPTHQKRFGANLQKTLDKEKRSDKLNMEKQVQELTVLKEILTKSKTPTNDIILTDEIKSLEKKLTDQLEKLLKINQLLNPDKLSKSMDTKELSKIQQTIENILNVTQDHKNHMMNNAFNDLTDEGTDTTTKEMTYKTITNYIDELHHEKITVTTVLEKDKEKLKTLRDKLQKDPKINTTFKAQASRKEKAFEKLEAFAEKGDQRSFDRFKSEVSPPTPGRK